MPYGSTNGGDGPAGGGATPPTASQRAAAGAGRLQEIRDKTVSYNAANSEQILNIKSLATVGTTKEAIPGRVEVENVGGVPLMIMAGYREWTSDTADAGSGEGTFEFLHTMVMPGEIYSPPVRAIIRTGETDGTESKVIMDGAVVDNTAPSVTANFAYADSGTTIDDVGFEAADTTITVDDGGIFKVNDLIQFGIDTSSTTRIEICRVTAISTNVLTLERALYGTLANDKDSENHGTSGVVDGAKVYFPFFNAYHDYDKYTVCQTDSNGKFKASNFFGLGRAASGVQGLIPGSIAIKFYEAGYQSLGLSGIRSSTDTKLEASGSYWFKIAIDGGTAEAINFTVDSENTNWGGTNGVLFKMQTAMDDKYDNSASNTFQQRSYVGIVDGDVRFTSGQRLSASAIALTAGTDGASATYNIFAQQNGHLPALANIRDAVAARLPDDVTYDRVTYLQTPNSAVFGYDDGLGNLFGMCGSGSTINYETGAIDMIDCPVNAEFVYNVSHTSAFSGKLNDGTDERINCLSEVYANTTSTKWDGKVQTRIYTSPWTKLGAWAAKMAMER